MFAQLGVDIGADRLVAGADKFGFDHSLDFDLPVTDSVMGDPAKMTEWETAWAAAGQPVGDEEQIGPFTTVLEMALVGCGIVIEKAFQDGGKNLREKGVRVESLAKIAKMTDNEVVFAE